MRDLCRLMIYFMPHVATIFVFIFNAPFYSKFLLYDPSSVYRSAFCHCCRHSALKLMVTSKQSAVSRVCHLNLFGAYRARCYRLYRLSSWTFMVFVDTVWRISLPFLVTIDTIIRHFAYTIPSFITVPTSVLLFRCLFFFLSVSFLLVMRLFPYPALVEGNEMSKNGVKPFYRASVGVKRYHRTTYLTFSTLAPLSMWRTMLPPVHSWGASAFLFSPSTGCSLSLSSTPQSLWVIFRFYDFLHFVLSLCVLSRCLHTFAVRSFVIRTFAILSSSLHGAALRSYAMQLFRFVLYCRILRFVALHLLRLVVHYVLSLCVSPMYVLSHCVCR